LLEHDDRTSGEVFLDSGKIGNQKLNLLPWAALCAAAKQNDGRLRLVSVRQERSEIRVREMTVRSSSWARSKILSSSAA
jgi:hypothetical protein